MSTTIIGTGNMGQALAQAVRRSGAEPQVLGHGDTDTPVTGDVVVLAVHYGALSEVAATRGEQLEGRVVVDMSNPVDFTTMDSLLVPADGSAAQELAALLPGARVVKAFNTTFAATLATGTVGGAPTTVQIAGDDEEAKAQVAALVASTGMTSVDAGSLRRTRELEALGFLQITLAAREQISWTGGYAVAS